MSAPQDHRIRTLWLSGVLHGFTHLYQMALIPLYLLIQRGLKLASVEQATLLVTVMGVAYFLPSYPMGVLADRFSRKKLMALGLAINGIGFTCLGLSPNYPCALVSVALAGFGGSFYHPAATALVARLYPVRTGWALGMVAIGASAGFFVSPIYSGWRAETTGDWRHPVVELGLMGLVFSGIFYWLAQEDRNDPDIPSSARHSVAKGRISTMSGYSESSDPLSSMMKWRRGWGRGGAFLRIPARMIVELIRPSPQPSPTPASGERFPQSEISRTESLNRSKRKVFSLAPRGTSGERGFERFMGREKNPGPSRDEAVANPPPQKMFPTASLWAIFLLMAFAFSLRDFAGAGMGSLGSLFLQKARGFNPETTGFMLSGIFLASAISNPLFGHLSDGGRGRWAVCLLILSLIMVAVFPHVPKGWMFAVLSAYGFFFLASYPIVEAALMESVPDAVRGRVFGLFITFGGLIGNLSHWAVGAYVKNLGPNAVSPSAYYGIYAFLAGLILVSLIGLPCLHAIRKREHLEPLADVPKSTIRTPQPVRHSVPHEGGSAIK